MHAGQHEHPTLRGLSKLPSVPRAGYSRRSVSRLPRSRAFDGALGRLWLLLATHLELQAAPITFNLRLSGFTHLNPTKTRMIKTTSTTLINIAVPNVVPLPDSPSFVVEDYSASASPVVIAS
jgi:hypothetical protein